MINYLEPSPLLTCFSLFLYLYIVLKNREILNKRSFCLDRNNRVLSSIFMMVLLFAMTPFFSGDFYHYIEWVEDANVQWNINEFSHIEVAYQYISSFVNGSYFPFRFIVWGGEIFLISMIARRFKMSVKLTLYLILLLFPILYSYARASLAMAVYFYGLSYILKPFYNRLFSYIVGVLIITICPIFHRSMYVLIVITPIAILPLFYSLRSKWKLLFYILGIIISVYAFSRVLLYLDLVDIIGDETLQAKLTKYSEKEVIEKGLASKLKTLLEKFFHWGSVYLFFKYCLKNIQEKNSIIEKLFVFSITILFIGSTLGFCGEAFHTLSYRISAMFFIPFTLMIAYSYQYSLISKKTVKRICLLAILYSIYSLIYSVYLSIVK